MRNFHTFSSLKVALNFAEGIDSQRVLSAPWFGIAAPLSNLLVILNSSINMIVYVVLNSKFKEHLLQMFSDMGNFLGCNQYQKRSVHNQSPQDNTEQLTLKTVTETCPGQNSPILLHDMTDNRTPVFV